MSVSDPFQDGRDTRVELSGERNLPGSQSMDRSSLDYFHPDGDGFTKGCSVRKTSVPGVITGIRAIQDVPSEILEQAVAVFHQTGFKEARKRRKTYIIFGCVYNAALALGYPVILPSLAKKCGMTPEEITPAMSVFSKCGNKKLIVSVHMTPSMFIYPLCQELNRDNLTEDVQTVVTEVLERAPGLRDSQPILVAAAAVHYYASILSMSDVTVDKLAKASGLTASSIDKMSKTISYYHNDCDE